MDLYLEIRCFFQKNPSELSRFSNWKIVLSVVVHLLCTGQLCFRIAIFLGKLSFTSLHHNHHPHTQQNVLVCKCECTFVVLPFLGHPPQEQLKQKLPLAFSNASFKSTPLASIGETFPCHLGQRSALQNQQSALLHGIISPTLLCTLTPFPTGQRRTRA